MAAAIPEKLEVRMIGTDVAVILPEAVLKHLRVSPGDEITLRRLDVGIEISTEALRHDQGMKIAERVMAKDHDLLRKLAES